MSPSLLRTFSLAFLVFVGTVFSGCAHLQIRPAAPRDISLCVSYAASVEAQTIASMKAAEADFVREYNSGRRKFRLSQCENPERQSLRLEVKSASLVGPGRQAAGVVITALGLTVVPVAVLAATDFSWVLLIGYLPGNQSRVVLSLSEDISDDGEPVKKAFGSSPYFGGLDRQRAKHSAAFKKFLWKTLEQLEEQVP